MVKLSDQYDRESHRTGSMATDRKPICLEALLERCMNDAEFALALLAELESSAPVLVDRVAAEVERGAVMAVAESMHALKGATGIVAAKHLSELARQGELAGRRGDLSQVRKLMAPIHSELASCLSSLPELRRQLS